MTNKEKIILKELRKIYNLICSIKIDFNLCLPTIDYKKQQIKEAIENLQKFIKEEQSWTN